MNIIDTLLGRKPPILPKTWLDNLKVHPSIQHQAIARAERWRRARISEAIIERRVTAWALEEQHKFEVNQCSSS